MHRWVQTETFLLDEAARDLAVGAPARPCIVAFADEAPLMVAFLRDHEKGAYADPMIELLAIAGGLGANRLMASFSARAWSLSDPIPPVLPGVGDLRQRVVTMHRVDGAGGQLSTCDIIVAYSVVEGQVRWGRRLDQESAEGWIPQALRAVVEQRDDLAQLPAEQIAEQVRRCDRLGHLVGLAPAVSDLLGFPGDPATARRARPA
jgi:hypothetical protein